MLEYILSIGSFDIGHVIIANLSVRDIVNLAGSSKTVYELCTYTDSIYHEITKYFEKFVIYQHVNCLDKKLYKLFDHQYRRLTHITDSLCDLVINIDNNDALIFLLENYSDEIIIEVNRNPTSKKNRQFIKYVTNISTQNPDKYIQKFVEGMTQSSRNIKKYQIGKNIAENLITTFSITIDEIFDMISNNERTRIIVNLDRIKSSIDRDNFFNLLFSSYLNYDAKINLETIQTAIFVCESLEITAVDLENMTVCPYSVAIEIGSLELYCWLQTYGDDYPGFDPQDVGILFERALVHGHLHIANYILEKSTLRINELILDRFDIDYMDDDDSDPILLISRAGHHQSLRFILENSDVFGKYIDVNYNIRSLILHTNTCNNIIIEKNIAKSIDILLEYTTIDSVNDDIGCDRYHPYDCMCPVMCALEKSNRYIAHHAVRIGICPHVCSSEEKDISRLKEWIHFFCDKIFEHDNEYDIKRYLNAITSIRAYNPNCLEYSPIDHLNSILLDDQINYSGNMDLHKEIYDVLKIDPMFFINKLFKFLHEEKYSQIIRNIRFYNGQLIYAKYIRYEHPNHLENLLNYYYMHILNDATFMKDNHNNLVLLLVFITKLRMSQTSIKNIIWHYIQTFNEIHTQNKNINNDRIDFFYSSSVYLICHY